MTDAFRPDHQGDDVSWVRARLGPANPVPAGADANLPRPDLASATVASGEAPWMASGRPARGRRRATVVPALVGVAALVAAVAAVTTGGSHNGRGSAPGSSGTLVVAAAAGTTESAKTAEMSVALDLGTTSVTAQGVTDLATGGADFTADLPALFGQVEIRSVGGVVYVKVPSGLVALSGGKPWVKTDPSILGAFGGAHLGAPLGVSGLGDSFDVTALLSWLRSVSGPVTTISTTDTVHGDATTHYRTTVDLAKAAASAPAGVRSKLEQAAQAADQGLPVDVWVDASGRLRRFQASFDASKVALRPGDTAAPDLGRAQVTVELWDFGVAVDVSAPPADQVGSLTGLLPGVKQLLPNA